MDDFVIDSSIWIDFFNKKKSKNIEKVFELMDLPINKIVVLPIVLQEVLQGIQEDKFYDLVRKIIFGFKFLDFDSYQNAIKAADLYRYLRKKGITIRKVNDCLIASICIQNNFILLHNDKDFDNIAKFTSLKIYK